MTDLHPDNPNNIFEQQDDDVVKFVNMLGSDHQAIQLEGLTVIRTLLSHDEQRNYCSSKFPSTFSPFFKTWL